MRVTSRHSDIRMPFFFAAIIFWLVYVIVRWDSFTPDNGVARQNSSTMDQGTREEDAAALQETLNTLNQMLREWEQNNSSD